MLASLPPTSFGFIYSIHHWPFPIKIEMLRNYICFTDLLIHINIVFGFRIIWNRVLKSITFDLAMPSDDIHNVAPLSHVSFWRVPSYTMYSYCFLSEIGRRRLHFTINSSIIHMDLYIRNKTNTPYSGFSSSKLI